MKQEQLSMEAHIKELDNRKWQMQIMTAKWKDEVRQKQFTLYIQI